MASGAYTSYYQQQLGDAGRDPIIIDFVQSGGGLLALGSAARYAATTERWDGTDYPRMGLWDGTAVGPTWAVGDGMAEVTIEPSWVAGSQAGATRLLYVGFGGAWLEGGTGEILARWSTGRPDDVEQSQPAILRFTRGAGRGVLCSAQPEMDVRSWGDWTAWDDRVNRSYDGEHDLGLFLSLLEWSAGGEDRRPENLLPETTSGRRIGVYTTRRPNDNGDQGGAYPGLLTAVARAVEYAGHQPLAIRDQEIYWADLDRSRYDGVLFPGGWAGGYWHQLGGYEFIVRDFVNAGGGYLGISAGAFYAASEIIWNGDSFNYPLDLYPGILEGPISDLPPYPDHTLTPVLIDDPDPSIPSGSYQTWYQGEGYFHEPIAAGTTVGRFDHTGPNQGRVALLRHGYGAGRAVYPNLHLEVEEGSERDWMFTGDNDASGPVTDPDSEWDLFASLLNWSLTGTPATAPTRPSVGLPSRFGQWDSTFEWISEAQDDDAWGDVPTALAYGDGRLSVEPTKVFHLAGFGAKTRAGLPSAVLQVEYSTTAAYNGAEEIWWTIDGNTWNPTGLVPQAGRTDEVLTYDLVAAGVDTPAELENLEIYFENAASTGEPIHFDRVWVALAADGDADGAPDSLDCDAGAADAWAAPVDPTLSWEGTSRIIWEDQVPTTGEGIVYDVSHGDLAALRADQGFDSALCSQAHAPLFDVADPLPGNGNWQLVRARNSCGDGGWGQRGVGPTCP
ncbi:MAG: BPL-N domain-containing protein [Acidobacteriota bacterium]|nr:BPL-N domain-containing protein [Acidobacteriota bacterium]